jgi:hypothetical protein
MGLENDEEGNFIIALHLDTNDPEMEATAISFIAKRQKWAYYSVYLQHV